MLHITNGDAAAQLIQLSGVPGLVLPWRDVLHEGPVPAGHSLEGLSDVRAGFIAGEGLGPSLERVREDFRHRDDMIRGSVTQDEVVLWFEADLYDQLQLLQLLDWFANSQARPRTLCLICIGDHPDIPRFEGLGQLSPVQVASLFPARVAVTDGQMALGRTGWNAFTASTPIPLTDLLREDTGALPYLRSAIERLLQEYPSVGNGLGRTERQVLDLVAGGATSFSNIFPAFQAMEERPFMGDTTLWTRIALLSQGPAPALRLNASDPVVLSEATLHFPTLSITSAGKRYRQNLDDYVVQNGIDRWLGGTHLHGHSCQWRWESTTGVRNIPTT